MNVRPLTLALFVAVTCIAPVAADAQAPTPRPGLKPARATSPKINAATLYAERCAVCHGKKGEGTPMGRPLAAPLMNGETVEAITDILKTGVEGTPMVSFAKTLTPAQIAALATYVAAMKR